MKRLNNVTIGADIELFLMDKLTKEIISAEPFIKGDKWHPYNFDPSNPFFAVSLDNVLAELCIPPVQQQKDWIANIKKSVNYINESIPEKYCTVAMPSAILQDVYLQTENAQRFGCDPDLNVWLRQINPPPHASNPNLRSGGGHIHIGYDEAEALGIEMKEWIIKAMDLFVGVPSIIQEPDNERKLLYGKAGAFRDKPYGVEYRTVSNYYLQSDNLMSWAYNNTDQAVKFVNDERMDELEAVGDQIQAAINGCDKTLAQNLIHQFNIELV